MLTFFYGIILFSNPGRLWKLPSPTISPLRIHILPLSILLQICIRPWSWQFLTYSKRCFVKSLASSCNYCSSIAFIFTIYHETVFTLWCLVSIVGTWARVTFGHILKWGICWCFWAEGEFYRVLVEFWGLCTKVLPWSWKTHVIRRILFQIHLRETISAHPKRVSPWLSLSIKIRWQLVHIRWWRFFTINKVIHSLSITYMCLPFALCVLGLIAELVTTKGYK